MIYVNNIYTLHFVYVFWHIFDTFRCLFYYILNIGGIMMTTKELKLMKIKISSLSYPQLMAIIKDMHLNDDEIKLLMTIYNCDSMAKSCMENYISPPVYYKHIRKLLIKIDNYCKYKNLNL